MNNYLKIKIEKDGEEIFSACSDCFIVSAANVSNRDEVSGVTGLLHVGLGDVAHILKSIIRGLKEAIGTKYLILALGRALFMSTSRVEEKDFGL